MINPERLVPEQVSESPCSVAEIFTRLELPFSLRELQAILAESQLISASANGNIDRQFDQIGSEALARLLKAEGFYDTIPEAYEAVCAMKRVRAHGVSDLSQLPNWK